MSVYNWSILAPDNANADANINWAEGMPPGQVNDSAREMMAQIRQFVVDLGGSISAGGTANSLTLASAAAFAEYANGRIVSFRPQADNTGAVTLNVNGAGGRPILRATTGGFSPLERNNLKAGAVYQAVYVASLNSGNGAWLVLNPTVELIPPGTIIDFGGSSTPTGWLLCSGQAVSRSTYAALFDAIGTTFGSGNGSTTFNLPDYRGRVGAGRDNMGGSSTNRLTTSSNGFGGDANSLGATGGSQSHTLTEGQLPSHNHSSGSLSTGNAGSHNHDVPASSVNTSHQHGTTTRLAAGGTGGAWNTFTYTSMNNAGTHNHSVNGSTGNSGGGFPHTNVQPTIIVNKLIKF